MQTNILIFSLADAPGIPDAARFVAACRERGVLLNAFGARVVRAVTHLDVDADGCERAVEIMVNATRPA